MNRQRGASIQTQLCGVVFATALMVSTGARASTVDASTEFDISLANSPATTVELDFGNVALGSTLVANITVSNLTGVQISFSAPINGSFDSCTGTLAANSTCTETANFLALGSGPETAGLGQTFDFTVAGGLVREKVTLDVSYTVTPLPAALPLFATGLCAMGLIGWRRKRKAQAVA